MPFNQVSSSFYSYLYIGAFAGLFFCMLLFLFAERYIAKGEMQKRIHILIFYLFLGYLLLILSILTETESIKNIFFSMSFSWFASFPVLIYGVMAYLDNYVSRKFPLVLISVPVLAFAPAFPRLHPYLFFFVFVPGWLVSVSAVFRLYKNTVNPLKRRLLFYAVAAVLISGTGLFADSLLVGSLQEVPLLTLFFPIWSICIISGVCSRFTADDYEPSPGDGVKYLFVPTLFFLSLAFQKGLHFFVKDQDIFLSSAVGQIILPVTVALIMAIFFNRTSSVLQKFVNKLSERYMSPLAQDLMNPSQSGLYESFPENLSDWLSRHSDVSVITWLRCENSRVFRPISSKIPAPFSKEDVFILEEPLWAYFSKKTVSLINPRNIETLSSSQSVFSKIILLVERGEVLIIPCNCGNKGYLPYILLMFFRKDAGVLKPAEIRDFGKLSTALDIPAEKFRVKTVKKSVSLPAEAVKAETVEEMMEVLRQKPVAFASGIKPEIMMIIYNEEGDKRNYYSISGNIGDENIPSSILPENIESDDGGLYPVKTGIKTLRFLPLKMTSAKAYLLFAFDEDKFVYEMEDREKLADLAGTLGIILERIIVLNKFKSQTKELDSFIEQAEMKLKQQRKVVAENIHDTVAQEIFAARMQIDLLQRELREASPETREELNLLRETVSDGLKHVRKLIITLSSDETDNNISGSEITPDIELMDFLGRIERETDIRLRFTGLENLNTMEKVIAEDLAMVVRESVNNIRKHADARNAYIRIKRTKTQFSMLIIDDGKGFELSEAAMISDLPEKADGKFCEKFGLKSIISRCSRQGCKLKFKTSSGKGTTLMVTKKISLPEL
jgi:signal transduction histidine kinase